AGLVRAKIDRVVIADKDAGGEIRAEPDKPGVLPIVGGAGLAGDRLADRFDRGAGAALHDAFHHSDELESRQGVGDLLTGIGEHRRRLLFPLDGVASLAGPLVRPEDGLAVAVLDAVD